VTGVQTCALPIWRREQQLHFPGHRKMQLLLSPPRRRTCSSSKAASTSPFVAPLCRIEIERFLQTRTKPEPGSFRDVKRGVWPMAETRVLHMLGIKDMAARQMLGGRQAQRQPTVGRSSGWFRSGRDTCEISSSRSSTRITAQSGREKAGQYTPSSRRPGAKRIPR